MCYFIFVWNILLPICWIIGMGLLQRLQANCFQRCGDRFIIAVWSGVVLLAITLLSVSLVFPLSPIVGAITAIALCGGALKNPKVWTELIALKSKLTFPRILLGLSVEVAIAAITTGQVTFTDTGLYHNSVIQWLAKFGTVPGLALLFPNFGFTSSWFALSAPFNSPVFEGRVSAVVNGFILLISSLHFLFCLYYTLLKKPKVYDWFAFISLLLLLPLTVINYHNLIAVILVSPSPDIPLVFIPQAIGWAMLVISQAEKASSRQTPSRNIVEQPRLLPLILAIGATTIKITALPTILVTFMFFIYGKPLMRQIIVGVVLTIILLLPFLTSNILTSGCPLYPSSAFCLNLPWSISREVVATAALNTHQWNPMYQLLILNRGIDVLLEWVKHDKLNLIVAILISISFVFIIYGLIKSEIRQTSGYVEVLILSIVEIVFLFITAPFFRFAIGYLLLVPCLNISILITTKWHHHYVLLLSRIKQIMFFNLKRASWLFLPFASVLLIISSITHIVSYDQFLLPPPLKKVSVVQKQVNDVTYYSPVKDLCWSTQIPCAFEVKNIRLRNHLKGLKAGFIKAS